MRWVTFLSISLVIFFTQSLFAANTLRIPILTYHNFDPVKTGSMTINTKKFEQQMQWLKDNGYTVIPLKQLVDYLKGKNVVLPAKPVVVTVDDGRKTVYSDMLPIVKKYNIPVTLFIYPSSISNASYALTWEQLKKLQQTGLFDIQSHTYWHPNFIQEKKQLSRKQYAKLVQDQLVNSKKILEGKLDIHVTLLAWPYGIYDKYLEQQAVQAGYDMAFSIDDRKSNRLERRMSQPRYMVRQRSSMATFAAIVGNKQQIKPITQNSGAKLKKISAS